MKNLIFFAFIVYIVLAGKGKWPRSDQSCDGTSQGSGQAPGYFWDGQKCESCANDFCFCSVLDTCTSCKEGYGLWDNKWDDRWFKEKCNPCGPPHGEEGARRCCIVAEKTDYEGTPTTEFTLAVRHTECLENYRLYGNVCHKKPNCRQLNDYAECTECNPGYYWSDDRLECKLCSTHIAYCSRCYVLNQCSECGQDANGKQYYLDTSITAASFKCQECDTGCFCDSALNKCLRCLNNSYYWEDLDKKCYSCTIINNCVTCKDKTTCLTCKSGYITNNNGTKCVLCDPNCSKCSFNASKGTEGEAVCAQDGCNNGFYYEADKCLSCVENGSQTNYKIARCNGLGKITQCVVESKDVQQIDHIDNDTPPHQNKYFLITNQSTGARDCILNQYNCKKMVNDIKGQCSECYTERGYVLVGTECQDCGRNISNCISCTAENAKLICNKCTETPQSSETTGYYVSDNKASCQPCGTGCAVCVDKDKCTTCIWGYKKEETVCKQCSIDKCKYCANQTGCDECKPGYQVWTSGSTQKCIKCEPNCQTCLSRKQCTKCNKYYYVLNGVCYLQRDNCVRWDSNGSCNECKNGFVSVNGYCKSAFLSNQMYINIQQGCSGNWYRNDGLYLKETR